MCSRAERKRRRRALDLAAFERSIESAKGRWVVYNDAPLPPEAKTACLDLAIATGTSHVALEDVARRLIRRFGVAP